MPFVNHFPTFSGRSVYSGGDCPAHEWALKTVVLRLRTPNPPKFVQNPVRVGQNGHPQRGATNLGKDLNFIPGCYHCRQNYNLLTTFCLTMNYWVLFCPTFLLVRNLMRCFVLYDLCKAD